MQSLTPIFLKKVSTSSKDSLADPGECAYTPVVLVCTWCFYLVVFHSLSNLPLYNRLLFGVHQRFWLQPSLIVFLFAGVGMNSLLSLLSHYSTPFRKYGVQSLLTILAACSIFGLLLLRLRAVYSVSNQRNNTYFSDYATAIMSPLPQNAILLINYDQLWTSMRYLHVCEGFRSDITLINLSMMTFKWFHNQHELYSDITFPGHMYHSQNGITLDHLKVYTLSSFVEANIHSRKVFITGKMSYPDPDLEARYDLVPFGLTQEIVRKEKSPSPIAHAKQNSNHWQKITNLISHLPDLQRYPEETWEWTIARDYLDKVTDTAAFRLSKATQEGAVCSVCLIEAVYFLESAVYLENSRNNTVPTYLLKNLGLAHVHLIQNKEISEQSLKPPIIDFFSSLKHIPWPAKEWKAWSSDRFLFAWGSFLRRKDAKSDPQYKVVKDMYSQATKGRRKS